MQFARRGVLSRRDLGHHPPVTARAGRQAFPLRVRPPLRVPGVAAVLALAGCERATGPAPPPIRAPLADVFETEAVLELGEDAQDSIASRGEVVWSAFRLPFVPRERSYWRSFVRFPFAVAGDSVYVASSLRYPVVILCAAGDSIGEIGEPSASYQPFPVLEPGSLAPGSYPTQLPRLLGGSNTLSRISVLGSRLVLTHGLFRQPNPSDAFTTFGSYHASLDVYDRHTGTKLYEDILLPEGSRVLGGGRYLYLLQDRGFPPWRITKLRFRDTPPNG